MRRKIFDKLQDPDEALEESILRSDLEGIDKALERGADISLTKEVFEIKGPHYLVLSYPLWLAISENVKDVVKVVGHLLSKGAKPSDYKTHSLASQGSTLVKACQLGPKSRNKVVGLLLEHGADPQEGRGAVFDHIDWSWGTKQENEELRRLLGMDPKAQKPSRKSSSKKITKDPKGQRSGFEF